MVLVINNILLKHLLALRSLDLGMEYHRTAWPDTTTIVPLTYLRLSLPSMDSLIRLLSTPPLSSTLKQLHVKIGNSMFDLPSSISAQDLSIQMIHLHTFTLVQKFFSALTIEWTVFEKLTSSKVMPVLRRANVSIFLQMNDLHRISSSSFFTDHRHVDVHFAFHLTNYRQCSEVTQYIPRGHRFHPREIVGATFLVHRWTDKSKWVTQEDPFVSDNSLGFFISITRVQRKRERISIPYFIFISIR
jgi:hypothetical protein